MPLSIFFALHIPLATLILLSVVGLRSTATAAASSRATCNTRDQPNPLAEVFPKNVTGVLNVTLAIVPIPLATARQIIPSQLPILENAYRSLLPEFPHHMYPVLVQAGHDHDIHMQGFAVDDFSRAGFEFPFVDLLNDGKTAFRWAPEQLIEASNELAIMGSRSYGTVAHPAVFDPPCDAYDGREDGSTSFHGVGSEVPDGSPPSSAPFMDLEFSPLTSLQASLYSLEVYRAIANQPIFAGPKGACDSMTRFFDTPLTGGGFEPIEVVGRVRSNLGPFREEVDFGGVSGIHIATAFVENNYIECAVIHPYLGRDRPEKHSGDL